MSLVSLTVDFEQEGMRADKILAQAYPEISRSKLQKLFERGAVWVDDAPISKSQTLAEGEEMSFEHPDTLFKPLPAKEIPFDVLYEDNDLLAINKPVGITVHPISMEDTQLTIANGILAYLGPQAANIGPADRPCIVHRLDKETSGVLLIAKTQNAFDSLKDIFASRQIHKEYLAVVRGTPDLLAGSITLPIGRSPRNPLRMEIKVEQGEGRPARTDWDRLAVDRENNISLIKCELHTGRTHQARVHLSWLGHPVLGDVAYGYRGSYSGRILLHAYRVRLNHPISGKPLEIVAPIPDDIRAFFDL